MTMEQVQTLERNETAHIPEGLVRRLPTTNVG
jgi:hypothetical protein